MENHQFAHENIYSQDKLALEARIKRLEEEIDRGYTRLGKMITSIVESETCSLNGLVDEIIRIKIRLREMQGGRGYVSPAVTAH